MENKSTFEKNYMMLEYFQNEFYYRHKHYWSSLIKFFSFTVIVSVLPIVSEIYGIVLKDIPRYYLLSFPGIGLISSVFSLVALFEEAKGLKAVNEAKYRLNESFLNPNHHYVNFRNLIIKEDENKKKKKPVLRSMLFPIFVFILELIIIGSVATLILVSPVNTTILTHGG